MTDTPSLAPLFELPAAGDGTRSLADLLAGARVLLVFHRGTW